jgi:flagellar basal-body rod protein FlgF
MEVVANNIANVSTPAFKGESMLFAEYVEKLGGATPLSFVQDFGTGRDTRQGALTHTGNTFDVALEGQGYMGVQTDAGIRYTRNGRLRLDPDGQIVTASGNPVLGEGDQPVTIPNGATDIAIGRDGTITTSQGIAGKLQVVGFERESDLLPAANGLYVTDATPTPAPNTTVLQGMIEESNVKPIVEMTRMMAVTQSYMHAKDMLEAEDSRLKSAIEHLGKTA